MDDLHKVRKRIAQRRIGVDDEEQRKGVHIFRFLYHTVMLMMFVCVAVLALLLNEKLHLVEMPAFMKELHLEELSSWLPFEDFLELKDQSVSSHVSYTKIKDDTYRSDTNAVYNVYDGVVLHIQKMENNDFSIVMKQDNGVIATYDGVKDVSVKEDERILKDKALGTYQDQIIISFMKDRQKLDMHEATQG